MPAMRKIAEFAKPEYASENVIIPVAAMASIANIVVTARGTAGMQ